MLNEPGSEEVHAIGRAFIHSVDVAGVAGTLVKEGVPRKEVEQMLQEIGLNAARDFSLPQAVLCGELLAKTRRQGLSLGDCVCLTIAACLGATAVTRRPAMEGTGSRADRESSNPRPLDPPNAPLPLLVCSSIFCCVAVSL
jgi:ribonuclease VapC